MIFRLRSVVTCLSLFLAQGQVAQAESAYGCLPMAPNHKHASIEGAEGVFFRVLPDLAMWQPFPDLAVEQLAQLSEALAARGTKLVYVPLPTRALALPEHVPVEAWDYGYDPQIAVSIYEDILKRLNEVGVANVDALGAVVANRGMPLTFYATDPRLSPDGGKQLAAAIGGALGELPELEGVTHTTFATRSTGAVPITSDLHAILQRHCLSPLPQVLADVSVTSRVDAAVVSAIASEDAAAIAAANVATGVVVIAHSDAGDPASNLSGFLAESSSLDVQQLFTYSGDAFGGMAAYLTSPVFQQAPPRVLVWINPISESLVKNADQPLRELVAAAGPACNQDMPIGPGLDGGHLIVDLNGLDPVAPGMLMIDTGGVSATELRIDFTGPDETIRSRWVTRASDQLPTRSFYVPADGLWPEGANFADIFISGAFGPDARVAACPAPPRPVAAE